MAVRFGREEEWTDFARRRARFLEHWPWFERAIDVVFARSFESQTPLDRTVFALGRVGVQEFSDIILLCGNGAGLGAIKLLRPLFERTITMMYLIRNPGAVANFLDRHYVDRHKSLHHMRTGGVDVSLRFSDEELKTIEADYQRVRDRYLEPLCKKCGTTRDFGSWSRMNLADMAAAVELKQYLTLAHYPTLQLHSTVTALLTTLDYTDAGLRVRDEAQRLEADHALTGAHGCLVIILLEQSRHFGLPLDEAEMLKHYQESWSS
jgi:hypothetical protein